MTTSTIPTTAKNVCQRRNHAKALGRNRKTAERNRRNPESLKRTTTEESTGIFGKPKA